MLPQIYPTAPDENGRPRIRTFHGRRGRISQTRARAFTDLVPRYLLTINQVPLDLPKILASDEVFLDFGCGMGGHTIDLLNRGVSVVAIDVHTAGICDLATFAHLQNIQSLRLFHGDGIELLQKLTPESIAQIDVYFPDPWPKARHAKRRLFNRGFLELCAKVLKPNGRVVLITDDENYAFEATEVIKNQDLFQIVPFAQQVTLTSFHNRALKLGHQIHKFELAKN